MEYQQHKPMGISCVGHVILNIPIHTQRSCQLSFNDILRVLKNSHFQCGILTLSPPLKEMSIICEKTLPLPRPIDRLSMFSPLYHRGCCYTSFERVLNLLIKEMQKQVIICKIMRSPKVLPIVTE